MLFVYKIIHDLRHPTVATLEWLEQLQKEEREKLSKARPLFTKHWRFRKSIHLTRALKLCKQYFNNQSGNEPRMSRHYSLRRSQAQSASLKRLSLYNNTSQASLQPVLKQSFISTTSIQELDEASSETQSYDMQLDSFSVSKKGDLGIYDKSDTTESAIQTS